MKIIKPRPCVRTNMKKMNKTRKLLQAGFLEYQIEQERKEYRKGLYEMDRFGNVIKKVYDEDEDED